jgi:ATP-dependent RNA helicase DeaD
MAETTVEAETGFAALGIDPRLLETLAQLGYEEPTPIQREAIPPLLDGRDLVGQAATGTGKTAAFALPLLQRLAGKGDDRARPSTLILVPTRELAVQVSGAVHRYGRALGASVLPVYGGQAFDQQARALRRGVDVVVATPGRALDHVRRGTLRLDRVSAVVLDEADEMLDMGFAEDIEALLAGTPRTRQTMLFSATIPPRIAAIARQHLTDPVQIRASEEPVEPGEAPRVRQVAYVVPRAYKLAALGRVLDVEAPAAALVFCRTRTEVDELTEALSARGYRPEALHGGLSQDQRDRVMRLFRAGTVDLLVATDVAARGLDIGHLSHVVNYHVPCAPESYVHRVGRVGRAGREGVAITLAEPREYRLLRNIERATGQRIHVAQVPTVADLRARRLELTRAALREAVLAGDLDHYRVVVESLTDEFDVMEIAMAAVKLAHQAGRGDEAEPEEIPAPPPRERERPERGHPKAARGRGPASGMTRIFVGAGRDAGVAPRDLVGAIANEAGVTGRDIGAIDIADRFALVEVPEEVADYVIESLQATRIKGKRVTVRRDRQAGGEADRGRPAPGRGPHGRKPNRWDGPPRKPR